MYLSFEAQWEVTVNKYNTHGHWIFSDLLFINSELFRCGPLG